MKVKILLLIFFIFCGICFSQWSNNPNENTRVTRAALLPIMASDGTGGAFIVYENDPGLLRQKYVQRLDRYGYVKFPGDGVRVSAFDKHQLPGALIVPDGSNGIIIGYHDYFSSNQEPYLQYSFPYVQRIDSSGAKLWGEMGVRISTDTLSNIRAMCADGSGGVFLLYRKRIYTEDPRLTFRLQLQHVSSSGELLFGDEGIKLNEKDYHGNEPVMKYDGRGGFLFTILNYNENNKEYNESVHYLNEDGQEKWQFQTNILYGNEKIILSENHIFITGSVVEYDIPSQDYFYHLRTRVIDWDGNLISPINGYVLKDSLKSYSRTYKAFSDDAGNLLIIYNINDIYSKKSQVYLQKLTSTGDKQFGNFGVLVFPHDYCQNLDNAVYDPHAGVVAFCRDNRFNPDNDPWGKLVYTAQRISLDGQRMWPDSGIVLTTQKAGASGGAVSDQAGGAIICWSEIGSDTRWGIFAQQISRNGNLGEIFKPTGVSRFREEGLQDYNLYPVYPNPFNENVKVKFGIPQSTMVQLKIFDITGKEVITIVKQNLFAGNHQVNWNGRNADGQKVGSGVYIIFMKAGDVVKTQKAILIK